MQGRRRILYIIINNATPDGGRELNVPAKGSTTGLLLFLEFVWVSSSMIAGGVVFLRLPLPLISCLLSDRVGSSSPSKTSSSSSSLSIASCSFISFSYAARWIILLVVFTGICDDDELGTA